MAMQQQHLQDLFSEDDKIFKVDQRIRLKVSEEICGSVKWTSLNGIIIVVEFDEVTDREPITFPGLKLCSTEFFNSYNYNCNPDLLRILISEDLILLRKVIPTIPEQSRILSKIYKSLTYFGFVARKGKNKKGNKKQLQLGQGQKYKTDKNQNGEAELEQNTPNPATLRFPDAIPAPDASKILNGEHRGFVWQSNSCYLDATLSSMFFTTDIFDFILSGKTEKVGHQNDTKLSHLVRKILKKEIVYPLRTQLTCPGENTSKLRYALKHLSDKIQFSFMDAEDFIFLLLERCLNLEEFITYNTGVSDFMHQIFINNTDHQRIRFVQDLLETSLSLFGDGDNAVLLDGFPRPAFFIEMPRSDGSLVHYKAVVPNLSLNLSRLLVESICVCGKIGKWFCSQCHKGCGQLRYPWRQFCDEAKELHIANNNEVGFEHRLIPVDQADRSVEMDLLSVICIQDHHYTTFAKCGRERFAPWLYFDSFDKVKPINGMGEWLQKMEDNSERIEEILKECPADIRRVALDCYICIYQPRKEDNQK